MGPGDAAFGRRSGRSRWLSRTPSSVAAIPTVACALHRLGSSATGAMTCSLVPHFWKSTTATTASCSTTGSVGGSLSRRDSSLGGARVSVDCCEHGPAVSLAVSYPM